MMFTPDTIAAIATPAGEGGVAMLRVSGPEAFAIAGQVFRPVRRGDPQNYSGFTVHYGAFVEAESGDAADDGLLTAFRAPRSYTGEDVIELSCHGGRATTQRLLQIVLRAGARLAEPGEFTQRAFLNGRLDLAQAEAVGDVIRARSLEAQKLARRQLEGGLSRTIARLRDELIGILAAIEVTIDFSDEVGELDYNPLLVRLTAARTGVADLLATAEQGRILREGLRVALVGRPNVGKSSLLNALLRTERAIVTPTAGTTRDLLEESANVGGLSLVLIDTAGIRDATEAVERIGVERARVAQNDSDVRLLIFDASIGFTPEDAAALNAPGRESGTGAGILLVAANKSDLTPPVELETCRQSAADALHIPPADVVGLSAATGDGLSDLEAALTRAVLRLGGNGAEGAIVAGARHRQALEIALAGLVEAEATAKAGLPGDFIAIDLRGALDALGQITGETVTEEIVHRIFRDFCVGK